MTLGRKTGGKVKGSKNKATIEREAQARAAILETAERERAAEAERLAGVGITENSTGRDITAGEALAKQTPKLMKEIAFDFARLWAGMAAFHQPYPSWHAVVDANGKAVLDKRGRPMMENDNPNFDEAKFVKYGELATQTALGAAKYQSPSLSAVMVGQQIVHEIEIIGGLPDDQDGGLAHVNEDALRDAARQLAGPGPDAGEGHAADVSPEADGAVSPGGEAEGRPLRKAVG